VFAIIVGRDDDVLELEVAVAEAVLVQVGERARHLDHDALHFAAR
jgi:hypothetical protein